jgi:hypothetical protein
MAFRAAAAKLPVVLVGVAINTIVLAGAVDAPGVAAKAIIFQSCLCMEPNQRKLRV